MRKALVVLGIGLLLGLALGQEAEVETGGNLESMIGVVYQFMCQMFRCKSIEASPDIDPRSGGGNVDIPEYAEEPPSTSEAVYTFGHNLLTEYRKLNPNSNVVFSPTSITAALSLVYFGSNGQTKELMESILGFQKGIVPMALAGKDSDKLHTSKMISVANKAFFAEELVVNELFRETVGPHNVESVPFTSNPKSAKDTINDFVSKNTGGLIPEVVSDQHINSRTEMVLVNAIYFKGAWKYTFPKKKTEMAEFKGVDGTNMVEFMRFAQPMKLRMADNQELDSKVVELPYGDDHEFAMYIIFPNTEGGWRDVEQKLTESTSFPFVGDLRYDDVQLSIPKWDLETDLADVTQILEGMGLGHLFNGSPDFSAMIEGGSFSLSEVIHKAKIKVHEKGTEAAASTTAISTRSIDILFNDIVVNHPFLYYVVDKTDDTIFFQGTITKL